MNKKILGVLLLGLTLIGCGPVYETEYTFELPTTEHGRLCMKQCDQSKALCQRLCNAENGDCLNKAKQAASQRYRAYVAEQKAAGMPLERDLMSFYQKPNCAPSRCHCTNDYRACTELCGGRSVPHRRCISKCGNGQAALFSWRKLANLEA